MAKMFIAGESVDAISGATYHVHNPANGEVVDTAPKGDEDDARRAIDAAEAAFDEWSHTSAEERGKLLFKAADLVVAERKSLAELLCREQGRKPAASSSTLITACTSMPRSLRRCAAHTSRCQPKMRTAWWYTNHLACAARSYRGIFHSP